MPRRGKKYKKVQDLVDKSKVYTIQEALGLLKKLSYSKFPGTIELHLALNLPSGKDPKSIKGSVALPHTQAKEVKVAVAVPENLEEVAKKAGAAFYKLDELIKKISDGKIEFDVLIAVPEVMPKLAPLGKVLGPRGLMPNPKNGTVVTPDKLEAAISEFKRGKMVFKADASGGIHVPVGKVGDPAEHIVENIKTIISTLVSLLGRSKEYLVRQAYLAPTMGPSVKIDLKSI